LRRLRSFPTRRSSDLHFGRQIEQVAVQRGHRLDKRALVRVASQTAMLDPVTHFELGRATGLKGHARPASRHTIEPGEVPPNNPRSEEHTSELHSLAYL